MCGRARSEGDISSSEMKTITLWLAQADKGSDQTLCRQPRPLGTQGGGCCTLLRRPQHKTTDADEGGRWRWRRDDLYFPLLLPSPFHPFLWRRERGGGRPLIAPGSKKKREPVCGTRKRGSFPPYQLELIVPPPLLPPPTTKLPPSALVVLCRSTSAFSTQTHSSFSLPPRCVCAKSYNPLTPL